MRLGDIFLWFKQRFSSPTARLGPGGVNLQRAHFMFRAASAYPERVARTWGPGGEPLVSHLEGGVPWWPELAPLTRAERRRVRAALGLRPGR